MSKIILADFVTQDQGTGAVHIAPGHGSGRLRSRLALRPARSCAPVDGEGRFTAEAGDLQGESVFKADPSIIQKLIERGALLKEEKLAHSYPHCLALQEAGDLPRHRAVVYLDGENDLRNQALRRDRSK